MIRILISIAIMAVVTYLIRFLPLALFQRQIKSRFIKDFLYYVPYAVLSALTFPGIFYATGNMAASFVGTVVALAMAYFDLGLLLVAIGAVIGADYVIMFIEVRWIGNIRRTLF